MAKIKSRSDLLKARDLGFLSWLYSSIRDDKVTGNQVANILLGMDKPSAALATGLKSLLERGWLLKERQGKSFVWSVSDEGKEVLKEAGLPKSIPF